VFVSKGIPIQDFAGEIDPVCFSARTGRLEKQAV
jgi:hypothetical protein